MADKRIIELTAADSIIDSDFAAIDNNENSGNEQGSRKIRMTKVKEYVNEDMVPLEMIADEWQAYEDYYPGDYVTHNGDLYRQKEDGIIIQISWVPTMWEKVSVGDEFKDAFKIATNFYSDSSTYNTDDLVVYQNKLYRCKEDNVTGTWTSSKWQQTTLAAELKNSGKVQDVKVNGTSVVTDTIANITSYKEVTQAQYDALPSSKTSDDVLYCIKDAEVNILDMPEIQAALAVGTITNQPIATFTDGSTLPMPKLEIAIEPIQEGSGDPSPTNIRPISGWDEMNVSVSGKNLLSMSKGYNFAYNADVGTTLDITTSVTTWTDEGNGVFTNTLASWARSGWLSDKLPLNSQVYVSALFVSGSARLSVYTTDSNYTIKRKFSNLNPASDNTNYNTSILLTDDECYVAVAVVGSGSKIIVNNPMIEFSETKTAFAPYDTNSHTYTIDLDGTRYGGTLDVVSGVLTVDRGYVDLGTLAWTIENGIFRLNESIGAKNETNQSAIANMICSKYPTVSQSSMGLPSADKCIAGLNWSYGVRVKDSAYTDIQTFTTAMNGVQLVYELATPIPYQLTPTQVNSLLISNVWANTGGVIEVKYYRNATTTINDLISRIEALES